MGNKILLTPVDDLVEIIKGNPNCQIAFLAKKLDLPSSLVEKWLVVLEEFKIITIKYKGFNGFVNITSGVAKHEGDKEIDIDKIKSIFVDKSKAKGLTIKKMQEIWPSFVLKYEGDIKDIFERKANVAGYPIDKIQLAWQKFREELNTL